MKSRSSASFATEVTCEGLSNTNRLLKTETSLAWLDQAFEDRDRGIIYAKYEPLLEPLRSDRRFKDLIGRIGLR